MAEQARKDARGASKQQIDRLEQQLREREEEAERERTAHDELRALAVAGAPAAGLPSIPRAADAAGVALSDGGRRRRSAAARRKAAAADRQETPHWLNAAPASLQPPSPPAADADAHAAPSPPPAVEARAAAAAPPLARSTSLYERHAAMELENQELKRQMEEAGAKQRR